jgi:hypothetical protein
LRRLKKGFYEKKKFFDTDYRGTAGGAAFCCQRAAFQGD